MEWYLPVIWAALIGTAVVMYVILDGFDLGIGILFPFARNERERDQMMRSVAPFWDGNETWLVLGGGGLWVAFPRAYAVVMPALYLPVIVMLLALVFRGVAFEFRTVSRSKTWLAGYGLLGATWLSMKTEGPVAERARGQAKILLLAVLVFMAAVSIWTPLTEQRIAARWFALPNFYFLWPVPVVTALTAYLAWRWIENGREVPPFLATIALFLLGFLGLAISNFPYLVPPSLTIWDTAAAPASQIFMLLGTLLLLPMVLGYVGFIYWLFRGKVREGESYH